MATPEQIERLRQGIMRFRELLDILTERVAEGERSYAQLFADCSPEEMETLAEKELQRRAAIHLFDDPSKLGDAATHLRFVCREFEREFEQVHDNVMFLDDEEEEA